MRCLLLLQYPQFTGPLNLMRVLCVFLALGKLGYGEVFSSFVERRPAYFFQSSKMPSEGNSLMSCCSNFFEKRHWDACICFCQLTGDLHFMVPSIWVACLLAHCVLIGSLAELLFSFHMRSGLAFLQMVDAITGKVISSMVIILALKVYWDT
jgi:hypothetical protein